MSPVANAFCGNAPAGNLLLINRASTYAHNDPAGAFPQNAFATGLISFLHRIG